VAEIIPNLYNSAVGPLLQQLYVRQALEYLINRKQIVSKVYAGYADPGNGPVPVLASGSYVSPLEKAGGPYPYSPSKAVTLLKAHGWKVVPNGVSTCQRAGTGASDCGAGIKAGEALQFNLVFTSGMASFDQQEAGIQSTEAAAGVKIVLKSEPFNTLIATAGTCTAQSHPASTCGWQLADFGYDPYSLDPTGASFFNTGGFNNQGGYSSTEMNDLINQTEYGSSPSAFYAYEDYAAKQLPWLWLPQPSNLFVYRKNLAGVTPLNPFSGTLNPEVWHYTKSSS
jgi:peptide/nickel transport system substrate-binding protein